MRLSWPDLIHQWELDDNWAAMIYAREGKFCEWCHTNLRCRQLAKAIVDSVNERLGTNASCLDRLCADARIRELRIAEINSAGNLHKFLARIPNLKYSEFSNKVSEATSEDLTRLSYTDSSFDLIITSDTLEHVPDVDLALSEIRRVLKPGGLHIFTVPIIMDRPLTRRRASLSHGKLIYHLPPSYHGEGGEQPEDFLVINEFGADFLERCKAARFNVRLIRSAENPALVVFVTSRDS
jgi:SAM-dependent methyltransferase